MMCVIKNYKRNVLAMQEIQRLDSVARKIKNFISFDIYILLRAKISSISPVGRESDLAISTAVLPDLANVSTDDTSGEISCFFSMGVG